MEITIKPTQKQHDTWQYLDDSTVKYILFGGGAGGGKSWLIAEWLLTRTYFFPGTRWFVGREELKRLMQSWFVTWNKVCSYHKIPQDDWSYNGQYNYIEFKNGSRIDLLDLKRLPSDPLFERFGSLEYTGGAIEEAAEVDFNVFDVLKSRIGRHKNAEYNLIPKILLTCNPTKNWLYKTVYKPFKEKELPKEWAFVQALYKDNPFTAKSYKESLQGIKNEATRQRLMFGNWEYDDDEAKLMEYDAIRDLFTNKTPDSDKKCLTIDIARFGKDKSVIMYWNGLQVKKIKVYKTSSIDFLEEEAKDFCNKYQIPRSNVIADEGGVGGGFVDHFKCKGFVGNRSAEKSILNEQYNFANLRTQCYYMLADKVNRREIGIDDDKYQETIVEELEQIREKNIDNERKLHIVGKEEIKEAIGHSPDFADTLMMRMWFELPSNSIGGVTNKKFVIKYDDFGRPSVERPVQDWLKV